MPILRSLPLCAFASALFSTFALAQSAAPAVRIVSQIDENHLVALHGNVHPLANAQNDRGPVSANFAMSGLTLVLSRSAEQQAAFDAYVTGEYDTSSPNYHQWLTPAQVGDRFGPAQADIVTVTGWLANHGFVVKAVSPDRMTINFSGTASQVQSAFRTEIHNLSVNGVAHIANMTDPQIPEALSTVVIGVKGLHNFFPHPLHRLGSKVQFNSQTGRWQRLQESSAASLASGGVPVAAATERSANLLRPMYTYTDSYGDLIEDVAPYDFATIYNVTPLWDESVTGTGQTIAIIGTSDIYSSDVSTFKSTFGLSAGLAPVTVHPSTGSDPGVCTGSTNACSSGDLEENTLDVEWSGAVAPGAQIVLVNTAYNSQTFPTNDPIFSSAQYVVEDVDTQGAPVYNARIMSLSYGQCELGNGTSVNVAYHNLWQSAAAEGIAVFVASGDSGSPACDQNLADGDYPYEAQYGLAVNGMASTPYNTAVGGTDFSWCNPSYSSSGAFQGCASTNATSYWSTSNISSNYSNAKGYVPEAPWNDTCLNPVWATYIESLASLIGIATTPANAEAACNYVYNNWKTINQDCESGAICSPAGQFVMAYLIDTVGAGGGASNCVVNDNTNASSCSSSTTSTGSSYGNLTLVKDGWPKPSWQTGVSGIPSDGVRDIPDVSFFASSGNRNSATLYYVSGSIYEVGGTSVATPEMAGVMALINQNAGSSQGSPNSQLYELAAKQTYSNCSAESGSTSSSCYFNDIDSGNISMPCAVSTSTIEGGAVYNSSTETWSSSSTSKALASPNCTALNSGDAVGTLVSSGTTPGFNASTAFDLATGLGSLNVANVVSAWPAISVAGSTAATVSIQPASNSVESDLSLNVTVTVSGSGATPAGTAILIAGTYTASGALSSGGASFTIPAGSFIAGGSQPIVVNYSGDATYAAATNSTSVTVTYVSYTVNSISSPAAISAGSSTSTTATISSSNGYKGTVSVSCFLIGVSGTTSTATCTPNTSSVTLSTSTASASVTLAIATVKTSAVVTYPKPNGSKGWLGASSGTILALLVFLGIPARRRNWRAMLGMIVLIGALGTLSACGGGGSTNTTSTTSTPTQFTFAVVTSGNPAIAPAIPVTFTVTAN